MKKYFFEVRYEKKGLLGGEVNDQICIPAPDYETAYKGLKFVLDDMAKTIYKIRLDLIDFDNI